MEGEEGDVTEVENKKECTVAGWCWWCRFM